MKFGGWEVGRLGVWSLNVWVKKGEKECKNEERVILFAYVKIKLYFCGMNWSGK